MRDELAGRVLDEIMEWSDAEQADWMAELRRMAAFKYDGYEGYAVGERFFERLARWLIQWDDAEDRRTLLQFVRQELIYISRDELNNAIACVYPDFIKPDLITTVAEMIDIPKWRVREVVGSDEFRTMRRKTLYLGLSDGARLDQLRRRSPELSHEQFWLVPEVGEGTQEKMVQKLASAISKQDLLGEATFERVVFVDDFYGSGTSLIRENSDGSFDGKLARARANLETLVKNGIMSASNHVSVVLYIASSQAAHYIAETLTRFQPEWSLRIVQKLPPDIAVTDDAIVRLCESFFDPSMIDEHKGRAPLGYGKAALPLVLHHNTPNNSISLLWADTADEPDSLGRHALFPRYERHHIDRP